MADYINVADEEVNDALLAIVEESEADLLTKRQVADLIVKVLRNNRPSYPTGIWQDIKMDFQTRLQDIDPDFDIFEFGDKIWID